MMPPYEVTLVRTVTDREVAVVEVEAENEEAARAAAEEMADGEDADQYEIEWDSEDRLDCEAAEVVEVRKVSG